MITIQELLYNRGLDRAARCKLVRHKERGRNLYELYRTDKKSFYEYQCRQAKDVFKDVDYVVSFVGEEGVSARFVGVYQITGCTRAQSFFIYDMNEVSGYEDLKERVIIKWENAISWHQWIKNKMEVLEICQGLLHTRFTDYSELILPYSELCEIVEGGYREWRSILSVVKGVYLITDNSTGKLYVGSAYGENGIWGRWCEYVSTGGHGGNKALKELTESDPSYAFNFQFSILMILPKTVTADEAIKKEQLFKLKLGSNTYGLNNN